MSEGFSNEPIGGSTLVRAAIQSPGFSLASQTGWKVDKLGNAWFFNITAQGTIQSTTVILASSGALLTYSGTPATGNLIVSIAGVAGTDSFSNSYPAGMQIGPSGGAQILAAPSANIPWGSGILQPALEFTTTDANQKLAGLAGGLLFNQGAVNQQMALILTAPDGTGNAFGLVLTADSDDSTIKASLALGTVTTDGTSETFLSLTTFDSSGRLTIPAAFSYASSPVQQVVTFTAAGTQTWVAPTGVTSVKAECWGAGGGGGGGASGLGGGGGPGGGEYSAEPALVVTAGNTYHPVVGTLGAGGSGANGTGGNGTASTMPGNAVTVTANGGTGGKAANQGGGGGAGGTGSTNTTHHNGGAGGLAGNAGGGGGSSAGTAAVGTAGVNGGATTGGTGGVAPSGGGSGGRGADSNGTKSTTGVTPGGGGGGAGSTTAAAMSGAGGQVRLTFTPAVPSLVVSLAGASGTDAYSNAYPAGLQLANGGYLLLTGTTTPPTPSSGVALFGFSGASSGVLRQLRSSSMNGVTPQTQADHTVITVTGTTATRITKAWSIPAADANVDTVYRLTAWGFGTNGSTLQTLAFSIGLNGAGLRSAVTSAPGAVSASLRWRAVLHFHILTTGVSGTAECICEGAWSTTASGPPTTPFVIGSAAAGGETFNTTIANDIELLVNWASTTGAPTLTCSGSMFERLAG